MKENSSNDAALGIDQSQLAVQMDLSLHVTGEIHTFSGLRVRTMGVRTGIHKSSFVKDGDYEKHLQIIL